LVVDREGRQFKLQPKDSRLQEADDQYLILNSGDEFIVTFDDYQKIEDPQEFWVVGRGYYIPLRNKVLY
jgi:hypothetical protein